MKLNKNKNIFKLLNKKNLPILKVFRSLTNIYSQVIDDKGKVLVSSNSLKLKNVSKNDQAVYVGNDIAEKCLNKKIKQVVFDRGSFRYIGRIKTLADSARSKGLKI
ncbi:MAG: 50S ribosomal protein L18 [Berkelbacteria bacterium GW2011_GWA2_35_9]|uniref:Large ribosomal subunit protein uL18 n=1 Tax=Berkelbacteria bacterium GW2011_GWA2_35_9 TaxID=1618333 RepID=A0A0G0D7J3_9BACT|nr:MAG: 50S ribosomal protein L18 [Berkelbacteria bacterium GW2011_GWA2_35_9]